MSAPEVYQQIKNLIATTSDPRVEASTLRRLSLYVTGLIAARHGSPAQVARALEKLELSGAKAESLERQVRRMENDPKVKAEYCFHPLARARLRLGKPSALLLILDPTLQEDQLVMVSLNVWYRGRSLPLGWTIWPANQPLKGDRFWKRIEGLLEQVAPLLPQGIPITLMADRAFGTPAFTDLVEAHGWHWVVRVQDQTHYQDRLGRSGRIRDLVRYRGERRKLRGMAFKSAGWRSASIVVYWGHRHDQPLCLVTDLKPSWWVVALYRKRFPIECTFRDFKLYGWRWEQGQVKDQVHMEHLLVGMAVGMWVTLMAGTWRAQTFLERPPTGQRYTRPWEGKLSLFAHGLDLLADWLQGTPLPNLTWSLSDWCAPNWSTQILAHHAHAFLLAA
jgi:hypothetical protein